MGKIVFKIINIKLSQKKYDTIHSKKNLLTRSELV